MRRSSHTRVPHPNSRTVLPWTEMVTFKRDARAGDARPGQARAGRVMLAILSTSLHRPTPDRITQLHTDSRTLENNLLEVVPEHLLRDIVHSGDFWDVDLSLGHPHGLCPLSTEEQRDLCRRRCHGGCVCSRHGGRSRGWGGVVWLAWGQTWMCRAGTPPNNPTPSTHAAPSVHRTRKASINHIRLMGLSLCTGISRGSSEVMSNSADKTAASPDPQFSEFGPQSRKALPIYTHTHHPRLEQ